MFYLSIVALNASTFVVLLDRVRIIPLRFLLLPTDSTFTPALSLSPDEFIFLHRSNESLIKRDKNMKFLGQFGCFSVAVAVLLFLLAVSVVVVVHPSLCWMSRSRTARHVAILPRTSAPITSKMSKSCWYMRCVKYLSNTDQRY